MKDNQVNDERVINQRRKITGEAYFFISIFLLISILVKQFVFNAEFNDYAVEFIAFFGSNIYIIVRNIFVGNDLYASSKKRLPIINSIVMGISTTFTLVILRYKEFSTMNDFILELIMTFFSSAVTAFLVFYIINKITKKRIKHIEEQYDDDEE